MHDVLAARQELELRDVNSYRSSRDGAPVNVSLHDDPTLDASPAAPASLKAVGTEHDGPAPAEESLAIAVAVDGEFPLPESPPPFPP